MQSGNLSDPDQSKKESETEESGQAIPPPSKPRESLPEYAPEVLTGGHGGSVPALIVRLIRKIFARISDEK